MTNLSQSLMRLSSDAFDNGVVVTVRAVRIDAASAIRFKDLMRQETAEAGPRVILDLELVQFIDSSGLGAIVAVMKLLAPSHALELCNLSPMVRKLFALTQLDSVFAIHGSVADALAAGPRD